MAMTITRYKRTRFWALYDTAGTLVCVCVYRKGAEEVARRLGTPATTASAAKAASSCCQ
jgi:hypothetical protein